MPELTRIADPDNRRSRIVIQLKEVNKTYRTAAGEVAALQNIDLTIDSGGLVAILGRSGSGKSTLLNLIAGIDQATRGTVTVAGTELDALTPDQLAAWRGRTVGIVFQFFQLLPTLTVAENVMLPMDFCGVMSPSQRKPHALSLLDQVGVLDQADKLPSTLSGGQQQRVAIARALANDPPLIVADEPTGNLDSDTGDSVFRLFGELANRGKTVLIVTHDRDLADAVGRQILIDDGCVRAQTMGRAA